MTSALRVGCAGWSYRDWVGPVYPSRLGPQDWLEAYASMFTVVEIDSTFYAIPPASTVEGWVQRTRALPEFRFCVKVPQDVSHVHLPNGRVDEAERIVSEFVDRVVVPLETAGRLEALLLQLPPTFAFFEAAGPLDALAALRRVLGSLDPRKRKVSVEFRHASWFEHVGERLAPEVQDALTGIQVGVTKVDGLGFQPARSRTTDWSYFRFHGRRTQIPPSERGLSHAPYNYLYSKEEIGELADIVRRDASQDKSTLVIFNNHYRGQAAQNASELLVALGSAAPKPLVAPTRASRLDEFGRP